MRRYKWLILVSGLAAMAFVLACGAAEEAPAAPAAPAPAAPAQAAPAQAAAAPAQPAAPAPAAPAAAAVIAKTQPEAPAAPKPAVRIIPKAPATEVQKGGTLRWALAASVKALDPVWTTASVTFSLSEQLYDTTMRLAPDSRLQNNLFESWEISDDQLNWTFKLRDGLTFEDGDAITTDDFIASTFRWADRITNGKALFLRTVDGNRSEKSLEKIDDRTFVFHLKEPYPITSLGFTGAPFIMKEEIAGTVTAWDRIDEVIESGPWKLDNWVPSYRFDLSPREGWNGLVPDGESVWLDKLQILEIPDKTTLLAALVTKQLDYTNFIDGSIFEPIKAASGLDYWVLPGGNTAVMLFNFQRLPFSNLKARQAMQAAMNMEELLAPEGPNELWSLCPAIFLCDTPNESRAQETLYDQRDMEKARRLYQEFLAEEPDWDAETSIVVLGNTSYEAMRDQSLVNAETLRQIGFKVDHQLPDWATAVTLRQEPENWSVFHTWCCGIPSNNPIQNWYLNPETYGWHDSQVILDLQMEYSRAKTGEDRKAIIDAVQTEYYDYVVHAMYGQRFQFHAWQKDVIGIHDFNRSPRMTNTWLDR